MPEAAVRRAALDVALCRAWQRRVGRRSHHKHMLGPDCRIGGRAEVGLVDCGTKHCCCRRRRNMAVAQLRHENWTWQARPKHAEASKVLSA
eukprot:903936-Prymnesium_polylepis.1